MTLAEPHARVNIKYNHADSKTTYQASLSRCHEYLFNYIFIKNLIFHGSFCIKKKKK